eukprot:gnl/MRDRNA2_/MRDRNA2_103950_c0_seq1.p1 gnl/MRDRNA2_/MRDRNA2_103950_c0~~gnl/MRDRNA2_/MRDRNA2_103950_c0_seq1.p1  ORF type:complete len:352 (+),score=71.64 gnl/MRDRNA2_/MRDRNA2_103950_c0_seq1:81-1136(+)
MCGRAACTVDAARCQRIAGSNAKVGSLGRFRPRYNIGPQSHLPVIRGSSASGTREVLAMQWGLVPAFAKRAEDYDVFKGGSSTFNARSEGLEGSTLWKRLLNSQRCIVVVSGFYEWMAEKNGKTPMFACHNSKYHDQVIGGEVLPSETASSPAPLLLAGLYDSWGGDKAEEPLLSTTILTMDPSKTPMERVHDRMPVFLTPETAAAWLDPDAKFVDVAHKTFLSSTEHAMNHLHVYEVSPLVSNVKTESPDCILPKKDYNQKQLANGLGRFFKKAPPKASPAHLQETPQNTDGSSQQKRKAEELTPVKSQEKLQLKDENSQKKFKFEERHDTAKHLAVSVSETISISDDER